MEHTKKFVLVDPCFVRPSMRDRVLSGLDTEISNILNSDVSDEIKARSYVSALARFRNYSVTPKREEPKAPPPPTPASTPAPVPIPSVPAVSFKTATPSKRPHKCARVESEDVASLLNPSLWRRTQRQQTKKKFGSQWVEYNERAKKRKSRANWIES